MVEPVFEKINIHQREGEIKEQIKADVKTDVSSEAVSGILAVAPWVTVSESEVLNGKIRYGGKVIFYISYIDGDGLLKKCECGSEFVGEIKNDNILGNERAYLTAEVDKAETDLSGLKLSVSAFITVKAGVAGASEVNALVGGENLVVKESELVSAKSLGVCRGIYPLEEEFEVSYLVEEVLYHRADAVITAVQSGVGTIIVDGEVLLSLIMLQKSDKNDIIKETRNLPFRMEIECEESMPNMQAVARVKERSFKTDIAVDENNGKSVVGVNVSLAFEGEAFADGTATVASDVFSTENDVEIIKEEYPFYKTCEVRSYSAVINGKAEVNELPVGAVILAVGNEKASIISTACDDGALTVTGVFGATAFVRDGDGKVFTRKLELPFEKSFDAGFNCQTEITVTVKATRGSAKITSLTEMETDAELRFTVYPTEKCSHKVVKEIKVLGEKRKKDAAISIYIPEEGEELWSLAKRLNVCPDTLIATNKDLQFPLTGNERIVIYRHK
ncbi:MAG: DUF3794 domain-containing protein [Clostridia bacterium]|nr:DUF3794 domain-containing protein [Clostridia bacterium]